jgi:hypothetical protein
MDAMWPLSEEKRPKPHLEARQCRHMRPPASEKLEIIRLVEESALPVRRMST